jgi:hypothetical protein
MNDYLNIWIRNFEQEVKSIRIEFDAFFLEKDISKYYSIHTDEINESFNIEISEELPNEIKERMTAAYLNSRPK